MKRRVPAFRLPWSQGGRQRSTTARTTASALGRANPHSAGFPCPVLGWRSSQYAVAKTRALDWKSLQPPRGQ